MRVLFVSSGNRSKGVSPITKAQAKGLELAGVSVDFFLVNGKGIIGYYNAYLQLIKLDLSGYDVIHAHYSLCGIIAALAFGRNKVVCSLMGSDVEVKGMKLSLINLFINYYWKATILKSSRMKYKLGNEKVIVLPNGVNFEIFRPISKEDACKVLGLQAMQTRISFIADPKRPEKNFQLAQRAVERLSLSNIDFLVEYNIPHEKMPLYINSSDVVILTSLREGSPNIVKESMACNVPVVSTEVGDVVETIGATEGCYIANFDEKDFAEKILLAIEHGRTNGRDEIGSLNNEIIVRKLIDIYKRK